MIFAGKTALDIAVEQNRVESVKLLLDAGSEVGEALLTAALHGSNEVVEALVDMGYDVTIKDSRGKNVLHIAISSCRCETIMKLLNAGVDLSTKGPCGNTALHRSHSNMINILIMAVTPFIFN